MTQRSIVQSPIYTAVCCTLFLFVLTAPGLPLMLGPPTNHPAAFELRWTGLLVATFWSGGCWMIALACRKLSPNPRVAPAQCLRIIYTAGCLGCLFHIALTFHIGFAWSHQKAFEHVERGSGVGEGIFVSYLFALVWVVDAFWAWVAFEHYLNRPRWLNCTIHGFMGFIVFNAGVVFGSNLGRLLVMLAFVSSVPWAIRLSRWWRVNQPRPFSTASTAVVTSGRFDDPDSYNDSQSAPSDQNNQ